MPQSTPFGFQTGQSRRSVNEYYVASSDTSTLAVGDPVKTNGNVFVGRLPDSRQSSGMLHVTKAASGDSIRGVIVGIAAGPGDNSAQSIPGTKQRAYTVLVNDNPQALWDVQADNTAPLSAMAGMYAAYTVGAPLGSVSSTVVNSSSIGATVNDLLIAEVLRNDGANSLLRVAFVQHEMAAAGGSPKIGAQIQSLVSGAVILSNAGTAEAATANNLLFQAAVDAVGPGGVVTVAANQGVVEISATIYHDNIIDIGAGTTVRLRDGSTTTMFRNRGWNPTRTTATSMTAVGRVGTITFPATPDALTVGKTVSVLGYTTSGYNGAHVITGRTGTTLTVRLPRTPALTTAAGTGTCSPVDEMIGMTGKGAVDYNEAGQAADGTQNTIAVIWCNVGHCFVGEGLSVLNAKKFNFLICAYRHADVDNLNAETASDIIHFLGPGTETVCTRVKGSSGDDSLAFTIGDVSWFNLSRGDFFSIRVDDLNTDSLQALIRISGHGTWKFHDIELANLFGSSVASPVTIADFSADLQGMDFDHIKVRGVNCETATAVPVVAVSTLIAGGGDRLDVEVTQLPSNGAALQINASTTTVRSVQLRVANPIDGATKGALDVSSAVVSSARVEGLRASYGSNVFAVWINAGNVQELMLSDCEVGGSGSRLVAQQGTMGRLMMQNIRHTSGYRTFEQNASANDNAVVMLANYRGQGLFNALHFEKTALVLTSNAHTPAGGASNAFISANGSGKVVTWRGDVDLNGVTESVTAGGATVTKSSSVVA